MMFWVIQLVWQYWELQISHEKDACQVASQLTYPALCFFRFYRCWIPEMWNWNSKFPRLSSQCCLQVKFCSGIHGWSASVSVWSWSYPRVIDFSGLDPVQSILGLDQTGLLSLSRSILVCRSLIWLENWIGTRVNKIYFQSVGKPYLYK